MATLAVAPLPHAPASAHSALEITVSYAENTLDVRHLVGQRNFTIGEGKAVDYTIASDDLPASEFPLIRSIDGRFVITFLGDQRGEIERDGVFHPLQWLKKDTKPDGALPNCFLYALPVNEKATLRFGNLSISVCYVTPPDRVEEARGHRELRYSAVLLALSSAIVIALGAGLLMSFHPETAEMKNFWVDNPRMAKLFGLAENKLPTRTPVVVFDSAPLAIGFDQTDVATRIAAEGVALDGCAAQLRDGSGIRATLFVTGGKVTRVDSEAMTREQGEEGLACVKEVLGRVSFPAADGRIVYTLGVNRR